MKNELNFSLESLEKMDLLAVNKKLIADSSIMVLGLSLLPYKVLVDGQTYNSCPNADRYNCYKSCINFTGLGKFSNVQLARYKRTVLFYKHRDLFFKKLDQEIIKAKKKAQKLNKKLYIRLNVLSDINTLSDRFIKLIDSHKDVYFYDYTKIFDRSFKLKELHNKGKLLNYNIVYSIDCTQIDLKDKIKNLSDNNISSVIVLPLNKKQKEEFLKDKSKLFDVSFIDGDVSDNRFYNKGDIVLLSFKGSKKSLNESIENNKIMLPKKYLNNEFWQ